MEPLSARASPGQQGDGHAASADLVGGNDLLRDAEGAGELDLCEVGVLAGGGDTAAECLASFELYPADYPLLSSAFLAEICGVQVEAVLLRDDAGAGECDEHVLDVVVAVLVITGYLIEGITPRSARPCDAAGRW